MRWKLLRRRLSISSPRVIVRRHLPWPLRWAVWALTLGFSAALALWAFEFGKDIAGLDRHAKEELAKLRLEVEQLRGEREKAISIANTAESLLKTEKTVQDKLAQQLKAAEAENLALRNDLGFFERLLPVARGDGVSIRSLQAEATMPGQVRYQVLVMQLGGKNLPPFNGRYDVTLNGTLDGKAWTFSPPAGGQPLQLKQYLRLDGLLEHSAEAVVKSVSVRVMDTSGAVKASLTAKLGQPATG
ncbi:MAG TPA: DUF6776 family protein [Burkholderiaceae bacterium]|nr:DUF6776 family protein [Burkholderiaceae bacterium]